MMGDVYHLILRAITLGIYIAVVIIAMLETKYSLVGLWATVAMIQTAVLYRDYKAFKKCWAMPQPIDTRWTKE